MKKKYEDRLEQLVHSKGTYFQRDFVFKVFDLEMAVGFFRTYWEQTEEFLEKQSIELKQQVGEVLDLESENLEMPYLYEAASSFRLEEIKEFTQFLRKSFLTSIYSYLESNLSTYARLIGGDDTLTFNTLDDTKYYLNHVVKIEYPFEKSFLWQELQGFRVLRNCIIHYQAETNRLDASRKHKVTQYIKKHDSLLSIEGNIIQVQKGYPEHIIDLMDQFCWSILVAASDRFKKIL